MYRRKLIIRGASLVLAIVSLSSASAGHAQSLADTLSIQSARVQFQGASNNGLFGTVEFTSASLNALPQWRRILDTMDEESRTFTDCTEDPSLCTSPALRSWRKLQIRAAGLDRMDKLHAVNRYFNRWPYKTDDETHGRREYWASPSQFMTRSGDCEDYAIAKYFALRQLGFGKEELRIVVLFDRIRNIGHAVLAIYDTNEILILDSLSNFITTDTRYRHYIPQYSMNESTRWAHVDHSRAIPQTALRASDN